MVKFSGGVSRYWKSGHLVEGRITSSQIPHPSIFLSRKLVDRLNPYFDSSYEIAADLKQQLFFVNILKAKGSYIEAPFVRMRLGGKSTASMASYAKGWFESRRAWNEVHGKGGLLYVFKKVLLKVKGLRFK
jgi:hypothetical protein